MKRNEYPSENVILKDLALFSEENALFFVCVTKSVTVSSNIFGSLCLEEGT